MFREWIYRLGSEPKQSIKRFFIGLAVFLVGAVGFAVEHSLGDWSKALFLCFLMPGFILACWGWLGIFANRFAQVLNRKRFDDGLFDNDKPK
jgi:hypothetical protein